MELFTRTVPLTKAILVSDPDELLLATAAAEYFLEKYLTDSAAERYKSQPQSQVLNLFRWDNYLVGRTWLSGHKSLAACLKLKVTFKPWEVRRKKNIPSPNLPSKVPFEASDS